LTQLATPPAGERRSFLRWVAVLAIFGVSLYLVLPGLLALFGDLPLLRHLGWDWFVLIFVLECASFASLWQLQRALLGADGTLAIACSQLAGNAMSHVVPGGAAAGGLTQRRMLVRAGFDPTTVTTALTAAGLVALSTLFALPILSLPAVFAGQVIVPPLVRGALVGTALFIVLAGVGTVFFTIDRVVAAIARFVGRVIQRLRPKRAITPDAFVTRLFDARETVRDALTGSWKRAIPAAIGNQLFDVLALQVALLAVGSHEHFSTTLLAYVTAGGLGLLPFTPGGLGFVEAGLAGMLTLGGVDPGDAALATLLYRVFSFWLPMPIGAMASVVFNRRDRSPSGRSLRSRGSDVGIVHEDPQQHADDRADEREHEEGPEL
jgi:hypothetical protein